MLTYSRALSIAGSDPSGGAGIQADLKAFSALGVYGMTAITAVVDENTVGVTDIHPIPVPFVCGQIRSCLDDIGADAVKIGMLHSSELIEGVAATLAPYDIRNIVLDPVMVATSGDPLLLPEAVNSLRHSLIPMARLITPNIPEAETLLGHAVTPEGMEAAAHELADLGASVLLKGGHLDSDTVIDILFDRESGSIHRFVHTKIATPNTHGTGCTLSSAVAALLARGHSLPEAVGQAVDYIAEAIRAGAAYRIGGGHGPVHHFHALW